MDFPGVGQKYFCRGAKSGKISFSPLETKKTTFLQKNSLENVKFQNPGGTLLSLPTPMPLKFHMTKWLKKITKKITNKRIFTFVVKCTDIYFYFNI